MKALAEQISDVDGVNTYGRVVGVRGLMVEIAGPIHAMSVGARIVIDTGGNRFIPAEVIGFSGNNAVVMPFAGLEGVRRGCRAVIANAAGQVRPSPSWLGRALNAMGEPIDGKGPLAQGPSPMPYRNSPPPAHSRQRVGAPLDLGVRALNTFLTCCRGQRLGIFAGSGVGKSVLLSMLARNVDADITVIGLIGERGREVQEFLQDDLGEEGLARSVVVVATSDEPALTRRQAAYLTLAIAEYFRDEDRDVLCLMDSVTRFAMAQREIGLSAGEPPTAKGYTPTVFTELPKLLERAGPGMGAGTITGIFTVLVDGDDHNEPIADAVRGHPGRPRCDAALYRRARAVPRNQRPQVSVPHHAEIGRSGLSARDYAGPPGDGDLRRYGGTDPARGPTGRDRARRSTRRSGCMSRWKGSCARPRTKSQAWLRATSNLRKS
jgi:flagellum-specific ATP synthase